MKTKHNIDTEMSAQNCGTKEQGGVSPEANTDKTLPVSPVFELKKIMVPVDFSSCSQKAVHYAIPFAKKFGAELVLLHVVEPLVLLGAPEGVTEEVVESTEDVQQRLQNMRKLVPADIATKTLVRQGSPHFEIIEVAKEFGIDLVILSTHGRTGLEHVLIGSTAERVVRRLGCPVLVVREHEHDFIHVANFTEETEVAI